MAFTTKVAVGIDTGGTFVKVAAVTRRGAVVKSAQLPSEPKKGPAAFVRRVCDLLDAWKRADYDVRAIGLALAGDVDAERGTLRFTPNLRGWGGFHYREAFRKRLLARVTVENDANAAVWGAYTSHLKRLPRRVVGVTLGTGVGGGLVLEGKLYRGATGSAGEIGHTLVHPGGRRCHCGARGCLEAYCGGYGILATAAELLRSRRFDSKRLRRLCPDWKRLTPELLSVAAKKGDPLSKEVWRVTGEHLGRGLANLIVVLNPEAVLLMGGVSRAGKLLLDPARKVLDAHPFRTPFKAASVRMTEDPMAGCLGAALLAWEA